MCHRVLARMMLSGSGGAAGLQGHGMARGTRAPFEPNPSRWRSRLRPAVRHDLGSGERAGSGRLHCRLLGRRATSGRLHRRLWGDRAAFFASAWRQGTSTRHLLSSLLLTACVASTTHAVSSGHVLSLSGGASFPMEPASVDEQWMTGFAVSGAFLWKAAPVLALGVEVGYVQHPLDTTAFEASIADEFPNVNTEGREFWAVPITAIGELDLLPWSVAKPYLRAGFGVYKLGTRDLTASGPGADELEAQVAADPLTTQLNDTVFATLIGVGLRTPITPAVSLTVDATYHVANTLGESTHFLPVRLGLQF